MFLLGGGKTIQYFSFRGDALLFPMQVRAWRESSYGGRWGKLQVKTGCYSKDFLRENVLCKICLKLCFSGASS